MLKSDKAKTAGKFIVIMLCFAILFFLLLPFLDNPDAASGEKNKKAIPQIFTSNPLSDLVRKVYAMFTRNQKRAPAPLETGELLAYGGQQPGLDPAARYSAAANEKENAFTFSASNDENDEAYNDATVVNEDGEWILVRQTAPEAFQRGMHEVNSSDSAYDKYIRLQLNSKYAEVPQHHYPQSKWARMWKPLKRFLGFDEQNAVLDDSEPMLLATTRSSASGGLATPGSKNPSATPRPGFGDVSAWSSRASGGQKNIAPTPEGISLRDLFGIESAAEDLTRSAEDWYPAGKDGKLSDQAAADRQRESAVIEDAKQHMKALMSAQVQQDAAKGGAPISITQTIHCEESHAAYRAQSEDDCDSEESGHHDDPRAEMKAASDVRSTSLMNLADDLGFMPPPLDMIVVFGDDMPPHYDAAANDDLGEDGSASDAILTKEAYSFLAENRCGQGEHCFWVGTQSKNAIAAKIPIHAAGADYLPDPLNLNQGNLAAFKKYKLERAKQEGKSEQEIQALADQVDNLSMPFTAYNDQDWARLQRRNELPPRPKKGEAPQEPPKDKPFLTMVPTAPNAQVVVETSERPAWVLYDPSNKFLNEDVQVQEQGAELNKIMIERIRTVKKEIQELKKKIAQTRLQNTVGRQADAMQKELDKKIRTMDQLKAASRREIELGQP